MSGDLGECAQTLIQALFRLAVCDYIGIAYGHDEPGPDKWTKLNPTLQSDAERFLTGEWAAHLGDLAGLTTGVIWMQAQRNLLHRPAILSDRAAAPKQLIAAPQEAAYRLQPDVEVAA